MTNRIGFRVLSAASGAQAMSAKAKATLINQQGQSVGSVMLEQTPNGVLLTAKLKNLPAGTDAFHVHAVGKCEPPFKSAKGHFNPAKAKHGILVASGMHASDMPNVHIPANGALTVEVLNPNISLDRKHPHTVFDKDGSAIVMHMEGDDYKSQPWRGGRAHRLRRHQISGIAAWRLSGPNEV